MELTTVWFILIAILYSGYFFLEGFDLGVGILMPFVAKDDTQRRMIINTIGPHWDGNEVWLITAAGATFAAFPEWYATFFSGFYLPLFLMLLALIIRGVAFEFRSKDENPIWRSFWDWGIFIGSFVPTFLWGIIFTNIIQGIPLDAAMNYAGGFWNLINPYALLGGVVALFGFSLHGALFLTLKISDSLVNTIHWIAIKLWLPTLITLIGFFTYTYIQTDIFTTNYSISLFITIIIIAIVIVIGLLARSKKNKWAFLLSAIAVLLTSISIFIGLFPRVLISNLNPLWNLTIYNSTSSPYTLRVMTIVSIVLIPFVLFFQGWSYWIFRKRITNQTESFEY